MITICFLSFFFPSEMHFARQPSTPSPDSSQGKRSPSLVDDRDSSQTPSAERDELRGSKVNDPTLDDNSVGPKEEEEEVSEEDPRVLKAMAKMEQLEKVLAEKEEVRLFVVRKWSVPQLSLLQITKMKVGKQGRTNSFSSLLKKKKKESYDVTVPL